MILSGNNSYGSATNITAGTLQGNTTSLQGYIYNLSSVVFDQTTDGTYAGNMEGSGSLTKSGSGTLFLTGNNTYTGATTVSAGPSATSAIAPPPTPAALARSPSPPDET